MDPNSALWYALGVILFLIALQLLAAPLRVMFKVAISSIGGGLVLWIINLLGGILGFHLALNPVSAIVVGMLGVPGVLGLGIIRILLG